MDDKKIILVVCWGNIHRSPIAEFLLNREIVRCGLDEKIVAISRGIQGFANVEKPRFSRFIDYKDEYSAALPVLETFNINIDDHVSTPISLVDVEQASLILAMDRKVVNDPTGGLRSQFPTYSQKMHLFSSLVDQEFDVEDPVDSSVSEKYVRIISIMENTVIQGVPKVLSLM